VIGNKGKFHWKLTEKDGFLIGKFHWKLTEKDGFLIGN